MKGKISLHLNSHPFQCESIARLSCIDSMHDLQTKQQSYNQYKNVAEQARNNMMVTYAECAEEQKQHYQYQYEVAMKEIQDIQRNLSFNEQLTDSMWTIIHQHLDLVSTHIEHIHIC